MVKRTKTKKKNSRKNNDTLPLTIAFNLGRAVKKVSKKVASVKQSAQRRKSQKQEEPGSFILKEIKAIADISGLTAAIQEMNEISLKHSNHPVISRLASRIRQLSTPEQEMLSRKFINNLRLNPYFNNPAYTFPVQAK
ncbi:MAG: hypothetical protein HQL12_08730, partial [Candidatus Omnitrophica bacterium]|nr:hypothetical protein [Candidatus Omnitrophota bacterium]